MRTCIRITVSVLLLSIIAWRTDWNAVGEAFAHLRVEMWLVAFGLYVVAQIASARRWQLFARALGFEHTWPQYCAYFFIGLYFSLVLPTLVGGDVIRMWYLDGRSQRKRTALASVFLERVNGLLVLIATACLGVLISPVALPWWIVGSVWGSAACAVLGLASVPILKNWQRLSSERRQQLQLFADLMRSPRTLPEATFMSMLVQACGVLILWCLGLGLGLDVPLAYYCVLVPMVSLLMLLPISVNGMGVREAGIVLFLLPLGVAESVALSLAFLWFITGVAVSLIGGIIYLCATKQGASAGQNAPVEEQTSVVPKISHG